MPLKYDLVENTTKEEVMTNIMENPYLYENLSFSSKDWEIFNYIYTRLFELDTIHNFIGFRLSPEHEQNKEFEDTILSTRSHPVFGKCQTYRLSEYFRKNGLYYLYAYQ